MKEEFVKVLLNDSTHSHNGILKILRGIDDGGRKMMLIYEGNAQCRSMSSALPMGSRHYPTCRVDRGGEKWC